MSAQHRWWSSNRPPKKDDRDTGVTFVDVLFALVVGKILSSSVGEPLSGASIGHLAVGAVLTITSWVGYHNSANRTQYFLRFWNLPIWLFLIDIALVYVYWLVPAVTVQQAVNGQFPPPEAVRVTVLVTVSAGLYVLWDFVALRIRKSAKYGERPEHHDIPARRYASLAYFAATLIVLGIVHCSEPHTTTTVIGVDVILIVLLLGYRTLKEWLTTPDALTSRTTPN
jgi:hypothetical protein